MKVLHMYIKSRIRSLVLIAGLAAIAFVVFYLYSLPLDPFLYLLELSGVFLLFVFIYDCSRFCHRHHTLVSIQRQNNIYQVTLPESQEQLELDYQELLNKVIDENTSMREQSAKSMTELKEYYAIWAHQIKTPISAVDLLLQVMNQDTLEQDTKELKNQMFKIDFYVDAVMNYLRLDDMSSDFKFEEYSIESVVKKTIKKFASQFISKRLSIELDDLNETVITDEKWLGFIFEQLLSNAIKYTNPSGKIRIYMRKTFNVNDRIVVIEDNGIGIAQEDLPRIFECGYTGYNGRMDKKSSGIGLYLSKKAADKLGNSIHFESELGVGTKVVLNLTQYHTQHE